MPKEKPQFFSIRKTAEILQVSNLTVWRRVQAGEIPSVRLGKRVLIPDTFFERLKETAFQPQGAA